MSAPDGGSYPYAGTGYANPHALTQLSNRVSTSSYAYDNDGNVTPKTTDGTAATYVWDYSRSKRPSTTPSGAVRRAARIRLLHGAA
jgi:uncharacterized protein RhaS with RHS repeats